MQKARRTWGNADIR